MPIGNLDLASFATHHLVLYGLMNVSEYSSYYEKRSKNGDYIVFDCGGFEKNCIDYKDFMECAKKVGAAELQVPDYTGDTLETLRRMERFIEAVNVGSLGQYVLQIVPQGNTLKQYFDCLWNQIRILQANKNKVPIVTTNDLVIGMSKNSAVVAPVQITKSVYNYVNRPFIVGEVHRAYPDYPIHLLGLHDPLELLSYRHKPYVRGVDSSTPVSHALSDCFYAEGYEFREFPTFRHLPRVDLRTRISADRIENVRENIRIVSEMCSWVGKDQKKSGWDDYLSRATDQDWE